MLTLHVFDMTTHSQALGFTFQSHNIHTSLIRFIL